MIQGRLRRRFIWIPHLVTSFLLITLRINYRYFTQCTLLGTHLFLNNIYKTSRSSEISDYLFLLINHYLISVCCIFIFYCWQIIHFHQIILRNTIRPYQPTKANYYLAVLISTKHANFLAHQSRNRLKKCQLNEEEGCKGMSDNYLQRIYKNKMKER